MSLIVKEIPLGEPKPRPKKLYFVHRGGLFRVIDYANEDSLRLVMLGCASDSNESCIGGELDLGEIYDAKKEVLPMVTEAWGNISAACEATDEPPRLIDEFALIESRFKAKYTDEEGMRWGILAENIGPATTQELWLPSDKM